MSQKSNKSNIKDCEEGNSVFINDSMDPLYRYLDSIARADVKCLFEREKVYKDSWKSRGGPGAYIVSIRKADRLDAIMEKYNWDIFRAIKEDTSDDETVLDTLRDLRRYLMLIEAEMCAQGYVSGYDKDT